MLRRALLAAAAGFAVAGTLHAAAAVGQPAPDFSLKSAAGPAVKLSDHRGKFVVLEWTNPGCPYVRKHYDGGNMPATQADALAKGAVWLSIDSTSRSSSDHMEPQQVAAWQQARQARTTALLSDEAGSVGKAYGARTTPHMYIVDPAGRLVYAGGIDSIPSSNPDDIPRAVNYVRQALGEAMAGKPVSAAVTRPYGCSIKY